METDLQESSADLFKLTNEILIIKGNIILCEMPCKNVTWLMTVSFPRYFTSLIWDKLKVQTTHFRHHPI